MRHCQPLPDLVTSPTTSEELSVCCTPTNPHLVTSFRAALAELFAYASANEDAVREIIQDYASLSPELAASVGLSQWLPEINRSGLETLAAAAVSYGVLSGEPDYDGFIAE